MEVWLLPNEQICLTFKMANGSGWLTNYRLILCEHPPGKLEGHTPQYYPLKDFENATIKDSTLTVEFKGKKAKIQLAAYSPSLLQETKAYIQEAAKYC